MGVGKENFGSVIIRSGALGAYVITSDRKGQWIDAFWDSPENIDRVVDVTGADYSDSLGACDYTDRKLGAGNTFLGGLAAGLFLANKDVYEGLAVCFMIETPS